MENKNTASTNSGIGTGTSTYTVYNPVEDFGWCNPILLDTVIRDTEIELHYRQKSLLFSVSDRVYKVIYSCFNDKLVASKPVFGRIIEAREESYEFD